MRVAFLCNVNHTFFSTVRHLRDRGIAADLFTIGIEGPYFDPAFDSFDLDYRAYTKNIQLEIPARSSLVDVSTLSSALRPYDFVVACGPVPGFMHRAGLTLDAFVPYGEDLTDMPFLRPRAPRRGAVRSLWEFPIHQQLGIRNARFQLSDPSPPFARSLDRVRATGERGVPPTLPVYAKQISPDTIADVYDRSSWYKEFRRIRDASDVVVIDHGRQEWRTEDARSTKTSKGSNLLIRAFATAVALLPESRASLVCFEVGRDVRASQRLVLELGIQSRVHWMPFMPRKDALVGLSLADLVVAQSSSRTKFAGPGMEGVALGKPVLLIGNAVEPSETRFPALLATSEEEMEGRLVEFLQNPAQARVGAKKALSWFEQNAIDGPLNAWERLFQRCK